MDLKKEELHQKQDIEAGFQIDAFRLAQFSNTCDKDFQLMLNR